jgi:hypothetical protein
MYWGWVDDTLQTRFSDLPNQAETWSRISGPILPFTSAVGSQGCKTVCVAAVPAHVSFLLTYPFVLPASIAPTQVADIGPISETYGDAELVCARFAPQCPLNALGQLPMCFFFSRFTSATTQHVMEVDRGPHDDFTGH